MKTSEELLNDFEQFKKEVTDRFKNYPKINDVSLEILIEKSLKHVFKEQEKMEVLRNMNVAITVSSVIIILLLIFIIYIMLFTVPI